MDAIVKRYLGFIGIGFIDCEVTVPLLVAASLVCALSMITFFLIVLI